MANLTESQSVFFVKAYQAALSAGHVWPAYAAAETALESGWGQSELAVRANNLFGQKQSHPALAGTSTLALPTEEFLHGAWVKIQATWALFPDWAACFASRMALLKLLAPRVAAYQKALAAKSGEDFIRLVSKSWSTDPERARKVLEIYSDCISLVPIAPQNHALQPPQAAIR